MCQIAKGKKKKQAEVAAGQTELTADVVGGGRFEISSRNN